MDEQITQLKEYMDNSSNTVAITGSGISYLYGMSRLKQMSNRMDLMRKLSPKYVQKNPEDFYKIMREAFLDATFKLGPSPVHKQLAEFEKRGMLSGIVTQNFDCLHQEAGSTNVIEFQGSFDDNICVGCGARYHDYKIWDEGKAPRCEKCGAPLMPASFDRNFAGHDSEYNERMNRAADMIAAADLALIMGTTGFMSENYMAKVTPKTTLVQINPSPTRFDSMTKLNIRRDAEEVFNEILSAE